MKLAQGISRLGTETAFAVLARARALEAQGKDIIHLEIGEPDFDTPPHISQEAAQALKQGYTHYCPSPGLEELRAEVAREIERTRGITVAPGRIVITPGAKPILFFAVLALLEPGDEAMYPDPGFPIYQSMINFVGATPVPNPLHEELEFGLDVRELRAKVTPRTKFIIINSPHNPTGSVLKESDLEQIAEVAIENDLVVLADEVYSHILYEGEHHSIASLPGMLERTILVDGFSKTYAMTGWRLGYAVLPPELVEPITRLIANSFSCTAPFIQRAGLRALTGEQDSVAAMVGELQERRDLIVDGLNAVPGISCVRPRGAFYVFPNVKALPLDCRRLADYLLQEAGVAVLPGTDFGAQGEGYLRLSYANSKENLRRALERIRKAVASL
ncbi:MAG TPA: pyridoxal phosphate-dependent aminotransferase [Dehalococcoidia bacterium]|jgi:aspartate/methionine/tyrosine aminotransferase|nr:pyridoxal phosphate-dependent aminotransferase [Dehalococcoidia bacterium]